MTRWSPRFPFQSLRKNNVIVPILVTQRPRLKTKQSRTKQQGYVGPGQRQSERVGCNRVGLSTIPPRHPWFIPLRSGYSAQAIFLSKVTRNQIKLTTQMWNAKCGRIDRYHWKEFWNFNLKSLTYFLNWWGEKKKRARRPLLALQTANPAPVYAIFLLSLTHPFQSGNYILFWSQAVSSLSTFLYQDHCAASTSASLL